jgi:hypothetical protein
VRAPLIALLAAASSCEAPSPRPAAQPPAPEAPPPDAAPPPPPPRKEIAVSETAAIQYVDALPPAKGKGTGGVHKTKGVPKSFDHSGRYDSLTGAIWMRIIEPRVYGPEATVEISVEEGRARAYLAEGNHRYKYVEATPGRPARMQGDMVLLQVYRFMLEAVGGEARGVSYRIWR